MTGTPVRFPTARALSLCLLLVLPACSGDNGPVAPGPGFDAQPVLSNVAHGVITATYQDLEQAAGALAVATQALADAPTPANLAAAREAWRGARLPWELSESFLFGPVDTDGIDPAIDSWPVNEADLDAVLASGQALTPQFVSGLEGTLKGFHTIEYLLWGHGTKTAAQLTPRELAYLVAAARSLHDETGRLAQAWSPGGGNYAGSLANAGQSGSRYVSTKAGMQELLTGMITIADEVANGKINDPLVEKNPQLEESRFSANSIADFQNNIRSLRNVYTGDYQGSGPGLDAFVASRDAQLDTRVRSEIDAAIAAIGAIPAPFSNAIFNSPAAVQSAQTAIRTLQHTLEADVAPLVDSL